MTLASVLNTGFEHGITPTYVGTADYLVYQGAPQVLAAAARSGGYGLRMTCPASVKTSYQLFLSNPLISGGPTKCVLRCAIRIGTFPPPGQLVPLITLGNYIGGGGIAIKDGVLYAWQNVGSGTDGTADPNAASGFPGVIGPGTYVAGASITDNGWHLIEMQWDTSSATVWTADWRVDLVAQPRATWNVTSLGLSPGGTTDNIVFGALKTTFSAYAYDLDDVIAGSWTTAGTDWWGNGAGVALQPGSDGTHTFTGSNASKGTASSAFITSATTDAWQQLVKSVPWPTAYSSSANIAMRAIVAQYAEIRPAAVTAIGPKANGVQALVATNGADQTAARAGVIARNSAGTAVGVVGDFPTAQGGNNGSSWYFNHIAPNNEFFSAPVPTPAAGWTPTEIAAIRLRVGCATTLTTTPPTLQAAMFEIDWPGVPLRPSAQAVSAAAANVVGTVGYDHVILGDNPRLYINAAAPDDGSGHHHAVVAVGGPANAQDPTLVPCYLFNGVNQYLEIADADDLSPAVSGAITLEMWIRPDTLQFLHADGTGYVHFAGKGDFNDPTGPPFARGEYMARMYNLTNTEVPPRPNRISGYAFNKLIGTGIGSYFQDPVTVGEWIHYALVINTAPTAGTDANGFSYDKGYTKIYKNGALRDQDALDQAPTLTIVPVNTTAPLRVGTSDQNSFFQGAIAKLAVYNSELSAAQIEAHYEAMPVLTPTVLPLDPLAPFSAPPDLDPAPLLDDLPPFEQGSSDIQTVLQVVANELARIDAGRQAVIQNFYPLSADVLLPMFEQLLGLPTNLRAPLDQRRATVATYMQRLKSEGRGLDWEALITSLVGTWNYAEHDPANALSPAANTLGINIPEALAGVAWPLIRDVTPAHLDITEGYIEGFFVGITPIWPGGSDPRNNL